MAKFDFKILEKQGSTSTLQVDSVNRYWFCLVTLNIVIYYLKMLNDVISYV